MNSTKLKLIKLTEATLNSEGAFEEKPALVNAEAIVTVRQSKHTRSGPVIVGQGDYEREMSVIQTVIGTSINVLESLDEITDRITQALATV